MYYTIGIERFWDVMEEEYNIDDAKVINTLWDKIVESGQGRFVEERDYIFTENETLTVDGYVFDDLDKLSEWVRYRSYEADSVEVFEGWRLQYDEVTDRLLGMFNENIHGGGITYADMIFKADEPVKKTHELWIEVTQILFAQKIDEMKMAMNECIEKLKSREIKIG